MVELHAIRSVNLTNLPPGSLIRSFKSSIIYSIYINQSIREGLWYLFHLFSAF